MAEGCHGKMPCLDSYVSRVFVLPSSPDHWNCWTGKFKAYFFGCDLNRWLVLYPCPHSSAESDLDLLSMCSPVQTFASYEYAPDQLILKLCEHKKSIIYTDDPQMSRSDRYAYHLVLLYLAWDPERRLSLIC